MDTNSLVSPDSSISIDAASIAVFVRDGGHVAVLAGVTRPDLTAVLDRALSELQGQAVRIGNPLTSPLELERILRQIGIQGDAADPVAAIRGAMAGEGGSDPSILVIEDAQTLDPDALATLAGVPCGEQDGRPGLAVILAGRPELLRVLTDPGIASLWEPLTRMTLRETGSDLDPLSYLADDPSPPLSVEPARDAPPRLAVPSPPPASRRSPLRVLSVAAMAGLVLAAALLAVSAKWAAPDAPSETAAPPRAASEPEPADPPAVPAQEPTAPAPAPDAPPDPSPEQLRRDFDAFLNRAGQDTADLAPAHREALFKEYLAWRARAKGDSSAPPSIGAAPAQRTP